MRAIAALVISTALPASAGVLYSITVDTIPINGIIGNLEFQFNPGAGTTDPAAAHVFSFTSNGTLGAALAPIGSVSGGPLPATVDFTNATALNDFAQGFTFGTTLQFFVQLDTPAPPSGTATSGTVFSFSLFDSTFSTPLLTNSISGAIATLDIDVNGNVTATTYPPAAGQPSRATVTQVLTPEPATGMLSGLALLAVAAAARRRNA